jgi:hypothetical protein
MEHVNPRNINAYCSLRRRPPTHPVEPAYLLGSMSHVQGVHSSSTLRGCAGSTGDLAVVYPPTSRRSSQKRHKSPTHPISWLAFTLLLIACGSDKASSKTEEGDDSSLRTPPITGSQWTTEQVAGGGVGLFTKLALSKDGPIVAYYTDKPRAGNPCTETGSPSPPNKQFWDLYVSQKSGGSWRQTLVSPVLILDSEPPGLDLKLAPSGRPALVTLTGDPIGTATLRYCGSHDLAYFAQSSSGTWGQPQTAVRQSGEAAVSGDTASASNHGEVVGYWPALAFDSSGNPAIAYRDVHTGVLQEDDERRADLELAWGTGSGWRAIPVDPGRSAGKYSRIIFDRKNRPVILYSVPIDNNESNQQGLWLARSTDNGTTWQKVRLFPGLVPLQPDLAIDSSNGNIYVVFYNKNTSIINLATLQDDTAFESADKGWKFESFGDPQYDEGGYSSLAVDSSGRLGVAYYRCGKTNHASGTCPDAENALVFAWKEAGADGVWTTEVVDEGEDAGECGTFTSVAFDSGGAAYIAYLCKSLTAGQPESRVRLAIRSPL